VAVGGSARPRLPRSRLITATQLFLLLGTLLLLPVILGYTAWTYWVFRGKVRPGEG